MIRNNRVLSRDKISPCYSPEVKKSKLFTMQFSQPLICVSPELKQSQNASELIMFKRLQKPFQNHRNLTQKNSFINRVEEKLIHNT